MIANGWSRSYLVACVLTVDLLALGVGMMQAWTSPVLVKLTKHGDENPLGSPVGSEALSWVGSLIGVGGLFSPFFFSWGSEKYGRRIMMLFIAALSILSCLMLAFGKHIAIYYAARTITGFAIVGMFLTVSVYIVEISETSIRGILSASMSVAAVVGQLLSFSIGPYVSVMWFSLACMVPAVLYLGLFLWFAPETPQYYIGRGLEEQGRAQLEKLRMSKQVDKEFADVKAAILTPTAKASLMEVLKNKGNRKAFAITVAQHLFAQFSGINAVMAYLQTIFEDAKGSLSSEVSAIIVGAVQLTSCFFLAGIIDRYGRKPLLLLSAAGMLVSEAALAIYFHFDEDERSHITWLPIVCIIVYLCTYSSGVGPISWIMTAELLPEEARGLATTAFIAVSCAFMFLMTKFFVNLRETIGNAGTFWFFDSFNLINLLFTVVFVFETKGKTAKEIQDILQGRNVKDVEESEKSPYEKTPDEKTPEEKPEKY